VSNSVNLFELIGVAISWSC